MSQTHIYDDDPNIRISLSYDEVIKVTNDEVHRVDLIVTNKSHQPLENIAVTMDVDDDGAMWDAKSCDAQGQTAGPSTLQVGALDAGATSSPVHYYYKLTCLRPMAQSFGVSLSLLPSYQVRYPSSRPIVFKLRAST